jgi:glucose-1-phosphate thymidylyltransferase
MKGIILAGGSGTRLYPITIPTIKQLLPVYDKPMIYYPLSTLMLAGAKDILIISTPQDLDRYRQLLGDGKQLGLNFEYAVQDAPRGIAEALIIAEDFVGDDSVWLVLGDNIYFGADLPKLLAETGSIKDGAAVFGYYVSDPERYGVVDFDKNGKAVSIEEKPAKPKSNYAVTGLYYYDKNAAKVAKSITPSERGELEITAVNNAYLKEGKLDVKLMGRGYAWLDTGTHDSLLDAANFVKVVQCRQGQMISCIEEIAFRKGYISKEQLRKLAESLAKTDYGQYLYKVIETDGKF